MKDKKTIKDRYGKKDKKSYDEFISQVDSNIKNNLFKSRNTLDNKDKNVTKVSTKMSLEGGHLCNIKYKDIIIDNTNIIENGEQAHGLVLTPDDFIRYFSTCCEEDFNIIPEWDSKNRRNLKSNIFKSLKNHKIENIQSFIDFTVSEWSFLTEHYFSWMEGSAPPAPSPSFLVKFREEFCQAYLARSDFNETLNKNISEYSVDELKGLGLKTGMAEKIFDFVQGVKSENQKLNPEKEKKYKSKIKKLQEELKKLESENLGMVNSLKKVNKDKLEMWNKFREYLDYEHSIRLSDDEFLDLKSDLMTQEELRLELGRAEASKRNSN